MGEFFRGWKRKTSLVTLTFACLFAGGWIRSSSQLDVVTVSGGGFAMSFASGSEKFRVFSRRDLPLQIIVRLDHHGERRAEVWSIDPTPWDFEHRTAKGQLASKPFSKAGNWQAPLGGFSYWTVVVPLALLSAWLLLNHRRKPASPQPAAEPA